MAPYESLGTVSYSPSIVTMALVYILHHFGAEAKYWSKIYPFPSKYCHTFGMEKLRWFAWLPDGEKSSNFEDMFSRFDRTPERYGQTDKRTDGRTELLYQYRASVC